MLTKQIKSDINVQVYEFGKEMHDQKFIKISEFRCILRKDRLVL